MKRTRLGYKIRCSSAAAAGSLAAVLFAAEPVRADPGLPSYLQENYGLSCAPECTFCHRTAVGGFGNERLATTPSGTTKEGFIATLRNVGRIVAPAPNTWDAAFANVAAARVDTDLDGTPDIDELNAGTDPMNGASGAQICGEGPTYGCVRVARGNSVDGFALVTSGIVLFAGIALTRRRRSR